MHIPAEVQAIGTFLASIGGAVVTVVGVAVKLEKILRSRREKAVDDERPTRRLPELAPDDATVDSLRALVSRLQRDNEALRDSLREATRANDVEASALRRQLVNEKQERAEIAGKYASQFYRLQHLEAQVEVLQREVNEQRRADGAGLSTPDSDRPGVRTTPPKAR